jgi:hypothetical protein
LILPRLLQLTFLLVWWITSFWPWIKYRVEKVIVSGVVDIRVTRFMKLQHSIKDCFGLLSNRWILTSPSGPRLLQLTFLLKW